MILFDLVYDCLLWCCLFALFVSLFDFGYVLFGFAISWLSSAV